MTHCELCNTTDCLIQYDNVTLCVDCGVELDKLQSHTCMFCKEPFNLSNIYSYAGLREVHISGLCETCFDKITME